MTSISTGTSGPPRLTSRIRWMTHSSRVAVIVLLTLVGGTLVVQLTRRSWPFSSRGSVGTTAKPTSEGAGAHDPASHARQAPAADAGVGVPPGFAPVTIDPARAAVLQLETAPVEERPFQKTLRTVGVVTIDLRCGRRRAKRLPRRTGTAHAKGKLRGPGREAAAMFAFAVTHAALFFTQAAFEVVRLVAKAAGFFARPARFLACPAQLFGFDVRHLSLPSGGAFRPPRSR